MGVPLGVLFLKTGGKRLHGSKRGDTQVAINSNSCNKTGDLDIFQVRLSRREPGLNLQDSISICFFNILFTECDEFVMELKKSTRNKYNGKNREWQH